MRRILAVLVMLATLPSGSFATELLSGFVGAWVGEGTVRPSGFDAPQKIRCKVEGKRTSPLQISFAGRCATTSGAGALGLLIATNKSGKNYAAKVLLSPSDAEVDFSGKNVGRTITLTQREPIRNRGRLLTSVITLTLENDGMIGFINQVTDIEKNQQQQALEVIFRRLP
ncbi:MAG: hypothetical protein GXP05_12700 [Alphaproteobacteria bacterium]|nr:hypothetical protein [Alphaproteobacteria bacterium]